MNRKERRAQKKNGALAMTPLAATLAQAFRAHQAGHRSDAERLYRDILAVEPRNAAALHLLGALLHQAGRSDEGASLMRQAIAIEPRNPDYHYNLGCVLNAAGRTNEAIEALSKAIELKPRYPEALFEIGNVYGRAGHLDSAEKSLRRALDLQPGNAAIMNNLGRVLRALYRPDDAIAIWQRCVTLQPDLAIAHLNIGMVRFEQNRLDEAEQCLRRALAIQPDSPEATQQLAAVLLNRGRALEAVRLIAKALSRSDIGELKATFAQCLLAANELRPDETVRALIGRAIAEAWISPAALMPAVLAILKAHTFTGLAIRRIAEGWGTTPAHELLPTNAEIETAAGEPLLLTLLEAAPSTDIDVERFLTVLRAALLQRAQTGAGSDSLLPLYAALAQQCFLNEYVFAEADDERSRVDALQRSIGNALRSSDTVSGLQLAALAAYRPLHRIEGAPALLKRSWPAPIAALLRQQIDEPLREITLRSDLQAATPLRPSTGEQTRDGPSPRWARAVTTLRPRPVEAVVQTFLPGIGRVPLEVGSDPELLIAGCGSGEAAIEAAMLYERARVLAIDDNANNLAFGLRQAQALGLDRIAFAQADMENLAALGRNFDVIESSILHRLADPWAAWSALIALLRAGGVMRIGFVGASAHAMLSAARDFAAQGNYQPDLEGIRLLRQNLLRLPPENPAAKAVFSADFFATGTCRALFFGAHHHRLTLPDIQSFLNTSGLRLLGVETSPQVRQAFAAEFPGAAARTDLDAWHAFFRQHATTFGDSYQLWLHKPRE
ncbi:MAG: tetratricopeptide repeat protein [Pseudomonadota bacterium]